MSDSPSSDQRIGKRIAKKVMREMLNSADHRQDIHAVAERYVLNSAQARAARKYINTYCRQLVAALKVIP